MHLFKIREAVLGCLFLALVLSSATAFGQTEGTNYWIKESSGPWEEELSWSLTRRPSHEQAGVTFNNPGFKALAIGGNTTANFTNSLWIRNLLVESPTNSANQLLLNYAGLVVPLRIDTDLRVGANSSLVSHFSGLRSGNFYLDGTATFDELSEASFGQVALGSQSTLTVSNAILNAGSLSLNLPATGSVAVVNLHGGSVAVSNVIQIGLGNVVMSAGKFQSPGISAYRGELRQSGGTNQTGTLTLPQNRIQPGQGNYYLSGGTLLSSNVSLGSGAPGGFAGLNGIFEQTGGVHSNSVGIVIWGTVRQAEVRPNGEYRLMSGLLVSPSIQFPEGGAFTQSGGTNRVGTLAIQDGATFALSGGSLVTSNTTISSRYGRYYIFSNLRSFFTQTGGAHVANQFNAGAGGIARLQGGSLTAPSITVGPEGELELTGAAVTNSGTFTTLGGARVRADGSYPQLGKLIVNMGTSPPNWPTPPPASFLDFGANGATLRFRDSRDTSWDSQLIVTNWSGSTNGGGTDRLYVGTSAQGLAPNQLARIRFANPAGLPAGQYGATILGTGEVVPNPRPVMNFTQSANGLVISWTSNAQLYTSTNVAGPFTLISGATSPFTNSFSEPQRFFILRSP